MPDSFPTDAFFDLIQEARAEGVDVQIKAYKGKLALRFKKIEVNSKNLAENKEKTVALADVATQLANLRDAIQAERVAASMSRMQTLLAVE